MRSATVLLLAGCALGAPPGFSSGDTWVLPLVDPLSDGRLIVQATIHEHGPYFFVIDRDSEMTIVDPQIIKETGVRLQREMRVDDYHDTTHPAFYAELTDFQVGSLNVSLVRVAMVNRTNVFDEDGRRIHGVLGKDFIADSLVFGFDRDRGVAWLQTQQAFKPPPGATVLATTKVSSQGTKILYRPIVEGVLVGGVAMDLHADFSMVPSQLAAEKWAAAHVQPEDWDMFLIDNAGVARHETQLAVAQNVAVANVARQGLGFVRYDDRRWWRYHLDGTLGLDFFRPFAVASDWHHERIFLTPRADSPLWQSQRFARWGNSLPACAPHGCVQVTLEDQVLRIAPDAGVGNDLEVVLRATSANGNPLPMLYLNIPAGSAAFQDYVETRYLGAKLEVADVSPFPRRCPKPGPCVMIQSPLPP